MWVLDQNSGPLEKPKVLLTAEPSLVPKLNFLIKVEVDFSRV